MAMLWRYESNMKCLGMVTSEENESVIGELDVLFMVMGFENRLGTIRKNKAREKRSRSSIGRSARTSSRSSTRGKEKEK